MQLSTFSDYALRTLMHMALAGDDLLTTRQIAEIHNAKINHLAKVTSWLVREQYVDSQRGRGGGLRLARPTDAIMVGEVLRKLERNTGLVECLNHDGGSCPLSPTCELTSALRDAQEAFFVALDDVSLASLTTKSSKMSVLLKRLNAEMV